ncbi:MAG TPA: hypothetical protein P5572_08635 [Phycisphaerae bacterium]|nr:hypothetical protein [Phycisphaerales bacterium]HRX85070.1 hypothetical protein [Phycisphaerae bacterium]
MRCKVELRDKAASFLRHNCTDAEVNAFYETLQRVRADPFEYSVALSDPSVSRYMLRCFRFGVTGMAVIQFNPARELVRVIECRRLPPRPAPGSAAKAEPEA